MSGQQLRGAAWRKLPAHRAALRPGLTPPSCQAHTHRPAPAPTHAPAQAIAPKEEPGSNPGTPQFKSLSATTNGIPATKENVLPFGATPGPTPSPSEECAPALPAWLPACLAAWLPACLAGWLVS